METPLPELFLSRPWWPCPSQPSLERQPALHLLRGLQTVKSEVHWPSSAASSMWSVPSFWKAAVEPGSHVSGAGLTPAQALPTRLRGQGAAHPWLFQADLGTLILPTGSCWT